MKLKKLFLAVGSLTAVTVPTVALSSCADKGIIAPNKLALFAKDQALSDVNGSDFITNSIMDIIKEKLNKEGTITGLDAAAKETLKNRFNSGRVGKKNKDTPWYEIIAISTDETFTSTDGKLKDGTAADIPTNPITDKVYADEKTHPSIDTIKGYANKTTLTFNVFLGPCVFQKKKPYVLVSRPTSQYPIYKMTIKTKADEVIPLSISFEENKVTKYYLNLNFASGSKLEFTKDSLDATTLAIHTQTDHSGTGYKFN